MTKYASNSVCLCVVILDIYFTTELPSPKFHHHKFDPAYPGICFLGDPWQETVTSEGKVISWDNDIGIRFTIPPGAVPESEKLHLTVRPCLNGPFVLPQDHDLASPMYLIQPACDFNEEVELSMSHFADIKSDDDLQSMTFVSAHSKPGRGTCRSGPEYRLRVFQNGVFHVGQSTGIISLKHFCQLAVARKRRSPDAIPESERSTTKRAKGKVCARVLIHLIIPSLCILLFSLTPQESHYTRCVCTETLPFRNLAV